MKISTAEKILDNGHAIYFYWYGLYGEYFIYHHYGFTPLGVYKWCRGIHNKEELKEFIKEIGKLKFYLFSNDSYSSVKYYLDEPNYLEDEQSYIKNPKYLTNNNI